MWWSWLIGNLVLEILIVRWRGWKVGSTHYIRLSEKVEIPRSHVDRSSWSLFHRMMSISSSACVPRRSNACIANCIVAASRWRSLHELKDKERREGVRYHGWIKNKYLSTLTATAVGDEEANHYDHCLCWPAQPSFRWNRTRGTPFRCFFKRNRLEIIGEAKDLGRRDSLYKW